MLYSVKCLWDHYNIDRLWNVSFSLVQSMVGTPMRIRVWNDKGEKWPISTTTTGAAEVMHFLCGNYCSSNSTIRKINLELTINVVVTEILDADTDHHAKGKSKTATISKVVIEGDTKFAAAVNFSMLKDFWFIFFCVLLLLSIFFLHR